MNEERLAGLVRKPHGFPGQHHLVVPSEVARRARRHPLLRGLLPTAAGYFPRARGHYMERPKGAPEWIIILCWSGNGWFEVGGRRQQMGSGETVFIPARAAHAYGAEDDDPWSIVWVHADGPDLRVFLRQLHVTQRALKLRLPADGPHSVDFHRVYQILEDGYGLPNLIASSSALRLVLSEMLRSGLSPRARREEPDPVHRASEWMRKNLNRHVTLAELGHQVGVSASHLSYLFTQRLGYPPMDYFVRLRVRHACAELDGGKARVKEIAASLGYSDPYYFSRLFRQIMGMSPRAYRAVQKG